MQLDSWLETLLKPLIPERLMEKTSHIRFLQNFVKTPEKRSLDQFDDTLDCPSKTQRKK